MEKESVSPYKYRAKELSSIHSYLRRKYGRATHCVSEKCEGKSKFYDWAKKTDAEYTRNKDDYLWLCKSCHSRYDMTASKKEMAVNNLWWRTGAKQKHANGERVNNAKLTEKQVKEIRRLAKNGHNRRELTEMYGIKERNLYLILSRVTWKHI